MSRHRIELEPLQEESADGAMVAFGTRVRVYRDGWLWDAGFSCERWTRRTWERVRSLPGEVEFLDQLAAEHEGRAYGIGRLMVDMSERWFV